MTGSNKPKRPGRSTVPSPCSSLSFDATVNSPQPTQIAALGIGEVLELSLVNSGQGVVVMKEGAIIGTLTGVRVAQLIDCMNSGFIYQAIVRKRDGGQCIVRVAVP